jgi:hypothetical protein
MSVPLQEQKKTKGLGLLPLRLGRKLLLVPCTAGYVVNVQCNYESDKRKASELPRLFRFFWPGRPACLMPHSRPSLALSGIFVRVDRQ